MTIAPMLTVWFARLDRNGQFRLNFSGLIWLNHQWVAIRVARMTKAINVVFTVWVARWIWRELKGFFRPIRFFWSTLCPVNIIKDSIEITKASS